MPTLRITLIEQGGYTFQRGSHSLMLLKNDKFKILGDCEDTADVKWIVDSDKQEQPVAAIRTGKTFHADIGFAGSNTVHAIHVTQGSPPDPVGNDAVDVLSPTLPDMPHVDGTSNNRYLPMAGFDENSPPNEAIKVYGRYVRLQGEGTPDKETLTFLVFLKAADGKKSFIGTAQQMRTTTIRGGRWEAELRLPVELKSKGEAFIVPVVGNINATESGKYSVAGTEIKVTFVAEAIPPQTVEITGFGKTETAANGASVKGGETINSIRFGSLEKSVTEHRHILQTQPSCCS